MVPAETQPNRPKASKGNPFEAFGLSHLGPLTLLYPLAFMVGLIPAAGPISDRDAYWHVLVGDEIRSTRDVVGAGDAWAWYDPPTPWTTSQWMSEVVMSGTVQTTGWIGLVALTLALATATLLLLAWVIAQRASPIAAPLLSSASPQASPSSSRLARCWCRTWDRWRSPTSPTARFARGACRLGGSTPS